MTDYRTAMPDDAFERFWRRMRAVHYIVLGALFAAIAFYFVPNRLVFKQWTNLTPDDFAAEAEERVVPVVFALKRYERDHGRIPDDLNDLIPNYLAEHPSGYMNYGELWLPSRQVYAQYISYNFDPDKEGWSVSGVYISGPLALPPVQLDPLPKDAPQP